jgi:hypothetical protein
MSVFVLSLLFFVYAFIVMHETKPVLIRVIDQYARRTDI